MTTNEINALIGTLYAAEQARDDEYQSNGGEVTDITEMLEQEVETVKEILSGDGVDELGRKMLHFQHCIEDLKAERDHINAEIKRYEGYIEHTKFVAGQALRALNMDRIKGQNGYSFAQYTSDTCKSDDAAIKELFGMAAEKALRAAGIPAWITCKLSGSASLLPEGELPEYFTRTVTDTAKFGKPISKK